ncbi:MULTISPECIES: SWIM zinc finger family protein [Streptomyces]|uniref:SWIM zinc finger family protein n=1 Tax=Streptomyces TaxID=1883 RepID=UPI00287FB4B4|nr:SWIM zinc finger family protein [Streptomyces sp. CGMCC 4.1456]WNF66016.1 SWIM zinc finger family protein [Streptomyces sp. CGMCC 4.1456]
MTHSGADEARRALRAAREKATRDPDPDSAPRPAPSPAPSPADQETSRPGDAAREALRRAVSERREADGDEAGFPVDARAAEDADDAMARVPGGSSSHSGDSGDHSESTEGDDGSSGPGEASSDASDGPSEGEDRSAPAEVPEGTPDDAPGGATEQPGPRAGDVAREALRAARDEARRAREEATREGIGRRRRAARQSAAHERPGPERRAGEHTVGRGARDVLQLLGDAFRMPPAADEPDAAPEDSDETRHGRSPHHSADAPHSPATPETPTPGPATSHPWSTPPTTPRKAAPPHTTSRKPRSMAAPSRDSELRRTFPAFPPREPDGQGFAESWWGNAWVAALEQGALDAKRLERGRGYAGQGNVDAITVTPGLVLAYVQGSRPRPYRVQVRLRTLDDADWERFLDAAVDRPGHIAALLDKEMPHSLADCGVPLLPGPGDLEPQCSCPDRGHPCKHAAALCYQTARLLDADPFVLLLLRGRGERDLLDALSRLSATRAARAAQDKEPEPLPGVRAGDALTPRALPPLPAPLPTPAHPEQPPAYPASPGGPDPFALDQLATDAAARAHALLATGRDPVGQLTLWQDAVRLAAARPGSGLTAGTRALYSSLASAAGRTPSELARAVAAWRQGGLEGLAVLEEPWDPPAGRFDRARPLLLAADLPAFRPGRNHLTHPHGHVQLRLGRDGLWYAYESEPGHDDWWPRGTPDLDPVGALTGLGLPSDL